MIPKYKIIYSPLAAEDLRSIYIYISGTLKANLAATNQINFIRKAIRALETMPERFPLYSGSATTMKLHKLPVKNYVIFYTTLILMPTQLTQFVYSMVGETQTVY